MERRTADHIQLVPAPEQTEQREAESTDERLIRQGIAEALAEGRNINNHTARIIAGQLHGGQASALYALASSGAILDEVHDELTHDFEEQPAQVQEWINWLGIYCIERPDRGPVAGWAEQAVDHERQEQAEQRRLGGSTLRVVEDEEKDVFPWEDAATWRPPAASKPLGPEWQIALGPRESDDDTEVDPGEWPDEQVGTVNELGWFALYAHPPGHSGGVIIMQDEQGFTHGWTTRSDEELRDQWSTILQGYEQYQEGEAASDNHEAEQPSRLVEVWVGSVADHAAGHAHGVWLDATLEPEELHEAVRHMLRSGYVEGAEEWVILDNSGFFGLEVAEHESLETVSRLARGITQHGEPFAHWAGYLGTNDMDHVERTFEACYRGTWPSMQAYVEHYLDEAEALRFVEQAPEWLRPFAGVDVEALAMDWEDNRFHVVDSDNARVMVFETNL